MKSTDIDFELKINRAFEKDLELIKSQFIFEPLSQENEFMFNSKIEELKQYYLLHYNHKIDFDMEIIT